MLLLLLLLWLLRLLMLQASRSSEAAAEDLIVDLASATWLYSLRYLPHLLLAHKVLEVVKEANNSFVSLEWISAGERGKQYVRALQGIYINYSPFLEAFHIDNNVVLLPTLRKVNNSLGHIVLIAHMHKGQILQNQTTEREERP